jgi:NTE family protein
MLTHTPSPSFFEGLSADDLAMVLAPLERRRFPAGAVIVSRGETIQEMYIVQDGLTEVVIADRQGTEHVLSRIGAGGSVGEMALFTGQPASATVRALSDVEVLVLTNDEFEQIAGRLPIVYRNLGAILSRRLTRTNSRWLGSSTGRIALLIDGGAPPLLGYALACSVAWHARVPTLFVGVLLDSAPPELAEATADAPRPRLHGSGLVRGGLTDPHRLPPRAHALLVQPHGAFAPGTLPDTLEELSSVYEHVLVQVPNTLALHLVTSRRIHLLGPHHPQPSDDGVSPGSIVRGWTQPRRPNQPEVDGALRIPPPTASDVDALRAGLLPTSTSAGKALGWAARDLTRLKVGVAFGGGGEKGYAHIGVWRVLERAGLPVDFLAGTSIGSAVASLHALGHTPEQGVEILDMCGANAFRFRPSTAALLSNSGLSDALQIVGKDICIEDLMTPLAIMAADITSGRQIVFRRGLLWPAVLASMSLPGIYPPQRIGGYTLVDGGVLNPVPSNVAAAMGADTVIAVRLTTRSSLAPDYPESKQAVGRVPTMLHTITRSIEMMQSKISADTAAAATITVEVNFEDVERVGLRRWAEARRYIELGQAAAEAALPRIEAALPWLGRQNGSQVEIP